MLLQVMSGQRVPDNRTGKTNAMKGPRVDFNAYREFHDRELEAHILASFMLYSGMEKQRGNM